MRKILIRIFVVFLFLLKLTWCQAQVILKGRVIDVQNRLPIPGVNIKVKDHAYSTRTDDQGLFSLAVEKGNTLLVSSIGFEPEEVLFNGEKADLLIRLKARTGQLQEVNVVSTGYQQVPKDRVTGAFSQVDSELFNRRVTTDVLSRLEDVVPGLAFNKNGNTRGTISIRGQSTLFANATPLIVVDNFPFEGDINSINPSDVESITVLKDAAAASIWGAQAGNGVIVITTKKGAYNMGTTVSFNTNFSVAEKPDLFYYPRISSADFIDAETKIFDGGYYDDLYKSPQRYVLSPVVELLFASRDNSLLKDENERAAQMMKQYDIRNDMEKYFYRPEFKKQFNVSLSGGSERSNYFLSAGYDHNALSDVGNDYSRLTVNAKNNFRFLKDRLKLGTGIYYAQSTSSQLPRDYLSAVYPYARLADETGNPLEINRDIRTGFKREAEEQKLLDWSYRPLRDIYAEQKKMNFSELKLNLDLGFTILQGLEAAVLYQYNRGVQQSDHHYGEQSYFARDMINRFTAIGSDGVIKRPVPLGGMLNLSGQQQNVHNVRTQLNFNREWEDLHRVSVLAGWELSSASILFNQHRLYGYDAEHEQSSPVDLINRFPQFVYPLSMGQIENLDSRRLMNDHFLSYYFNGAYTFMNKYTFSASLRKDQSNIFGVRANQKGVPLYSVGLSWDLAREEFFSTHVIESMKLRATYGRSGNVDKTLSAYTTASFMPNAPSTRLPYARITNPPNADLRWERINTANFGLDFRLTSGWLSGSVDYYFKKGFDLIGNTPFAPSTGIVNFRGNTASTRTSGIDFILSASLGKGTFNWNGNLLGNYSRERVVDYPVENVGSYYVFSGESGLYPLAGRHLYGLYSFPWAGLNPSTGAAQGLTNGEVSENYGSILYEALLKDVIYHGPARPTFFGAFRNTFSWKSLSASVNIAYRFGYYFRKESIYYSSLFNGNTVHGDFTNRWQKPGDELRTNVPALNSYPNYDEESFYNMSEALVYKADNIRLQDITLNYQFGKRHVFGIPLINTQLYLNANNLGMLWRANKVGVDPDYQQAKPVKSLAIGIKASF